MLTVLIPHHLNQNQHLLDWCLESLLKQDVEKEVIVLADSIKRPDVPKGVILHHATDGSLAFCSKKINTGIRLASPQSTHVFMGADDIILGKHALQKMQQAAGQDTMVNALSNCDDINILKQQGHNAWMFKKDHNVSTLYLDDARQAIHDFEPSSTSQFVLGTNRLYLYGTMVPRTLIEKVGPADEAFEAGWEDEDYCLRASIHRFKLGIDTSSFIYHIGGQTVQHSEHNPKNKEYFKKKWGIDMLPAATMLGFGGLCATAQLMNDHAITLGGMKVRMEETPNGL